MLTPTEENKKIVDEHLTTVVATLEVRRSVWVTWRHARGWLPQLRTTLCNFVCWNRTATGSQAWVLPLGLCVAAQRFVLRRGGGQDPRPVREPPRGRHVHHGAPGRGGLPFLCHGLRLRAGAAAGGWRVRAAREGENVPARPDGPVVGTDEACRCAAAQCFEMPGFFRVVVCAPQDILRRAFTKLAAFCTKHHA